MIPAIRAAPHQFIGSYPACGSPGVPLASPLCVLFLIAAGLHEQHAAAYNGALAATLQRFPTELNTGALALHAAAWGAALAAPGLAGKSAGLPLRAGADEVSHCSPAGAVGAVCAEPAPDTGEPHRDGMQLFLAQRSILLPAERVSVHVQQQLESELCRGCSMACCPCCLSPARPFRPRQGSAHCSARLQRRWALHRLQPGAAVLPGTA